MVPKVRMLVFMLMLLGCSLAVRVISPVQTEVENHDVVYLGEIGPGQTIEIQINPRVDQGGILGKGGYYDIAKATDLPSGWSSEASKLYGNPLQVTLTAPSGAREGEYSSEITVIDEMNGEELGNITFTVAVNITWDVLGMDVSPAIQTVGPGQPAKFTITIYNKGAASDAFEVSAHGARQWEFKKAVFVPAKSSKMIFYEIAGKEEETYKSQVSIVSLASDKIHQERNVTLNIRPDLISDCKATNHGTLIFPMFEAMIYAMAGLLSNFF